MRKFFVVGGALLLIAVVSFIVYHKIVYKTEISEFTLTAVGADEAGVPENAQFTLSTTGELSPQVIEKYLTFSPHVDFDVTRVLGDTKKFTIAPLEKLKSESVYSLSIQKGPIASRPFSWAYQIKAPFAVVSSIPGNKGVDVPITSGIEIQFNRANIVDPEDFFSIQPAVDGRFDVLDQTVRFLPKSPLKEQTVYTVRLKAGLTAKDTKDVLSNDTVISFETGRSYDLQVPTVTFNRQFMEFTPDSPILFDVNASHADTARLSVYKFSDTSEYVQILSTASSNAPWARYYFSQSITLPESQKIFSSDVSLEKLNEYLETVRSPQTLSTGHYLAVLSVGASKSQAVFEVNPNVSFSAVAGGNSIVWLKESKTGNPLDGVTVDFNGVSLGKTDNDGVLLFKTPDILLQKQGESYDVKKRGFFRARIPGNELIIPAETQYGYPVKVGAPENWWNYVSLNKNIYLPTDTLRFWTVLKSRFGKSLGNEIRVTLTNSYWGSSESAIVYKEMTTSVSDFGAITGELSYENLSPGLYQLNFFDNTEQVAQTTVYVSAYIKPAYKIILSSDKNVAFAGDTIRFDVKAEFFDGTPVSNTTLTYDSYDGSNGKGANGLIALGANGQGTFSIKSQYNAENSYWPTYMFVTVRPKNAEEGDIQSGSAVALFGPRIYENIDQKIENGTTTFTVKSNAVVIRDFSRSAPFWDETEYVGAPVPISTSVAISNLEYVKVQSGQGYDPINKTTYPIYYYKIIEHDEGTKILSANSNGIALFTFTPEKSKNYKFVFSASDADGRIVKNTRYVYSGDVDGATDMYAENQYSFNNIHREKRYKIGEKVTIPLQTVAGGVPENGQKKFIYLTVSNGSMSYQVSDTPVYEQSFKESFVPNISVSAGWFEGGRFHNSYPENISFDQNERRLNIEVSTNKPTYKPGDVVSLQIKVTDKSRNPVKSEVNISALDEAVFSVSPYEQDPVGVLYRDIYSQIIIRTSNVPPYGGGGAERGGGGNGENARSKIEEVAIYKSVVTDAMGKARVEFKLPDNITSWRLTTQAVTKDLYAGKNVHFIPVTLPLFVDATFNKTYLAGDSLIMRLRAFGKGLLEGKPVSFSAESTLIPSRTIEKTGIANQDFDLGVLQLGKHDLVVTAKQGRLSDSLKRTVNVVDTYLTRNVTKHYRYAPNVKFQNESANGYVTLTFSQFERGELYNILKNISYADSGMRIDQKGGSVMANQLLETYFGEKNNTTTKSLEMYQSEDGGLTLFPYSSSDLELSSIGAHLLKNDMINTVRLKRYLYDSTTNGKADIKRISRALYGLAAFNEPVLLKIQKIKYERSLSLDDKIFVALALDAIGAKEDARSYFAQEIAKEVVNRAGYSYLDVKNDDMKSILSMRVAFLLERIGDVSSRQFFEYAKNNLPTETLMNFEQILYIQKVLQGSDTQSTSFEFTARDKSESKTLKNGETFTVTLTTEELNSLSIRDVVGDLGIAVSYEKKFAQEEKNEFDKNISIDRIYSVNGITRKTFSDGDIVMIKLVPRWNTGSIGGVYQITDHAPSGLRPADILYSGISGTRIYPLEINDQKVTFVVNRNTNIPIYYFARVVSKGIYKADKAIIESISTPSSFNVSDEDTITIK